jgi:hypothetical protein
MSDASRGPGWWQASDGKWYPPEQHPDAHRLPDPPPASTPRPGPPPTGPTPIIQDTSRRGRWKWWAAGVVVAAIVLAVIAATADTDDTPSDDADTVAEPAGEASTTTDTGSAVTTEPPAMTDAPATTGTSATTDAPATSATTEPPATTETSETSATTEPPATSQPAVPSGPTCTIRGVDDFSDIQVELAFTNTAGDVGSLEVTYVLLDRSGVRFATESAFVEYPAAGERFRVDEDTLTELPVGVDEASVTCQILGIEEGFFSDDLVAPTEPFSCTFVEVDDFGDIQVDLIVTSPFGDTEDITIAYALRAPDGTRFADSRAFVDLVAPGETVRVAEDSLTDVPGWIDGGDVACDVLGVATSF